MKRNKTKTLRNKCDKLWAEVTKIIHRAKHGSICLWCKKRTNKLQSDHIFNRWKSATRWNLSNCVCLCAPCHLFIKKRDPLGWSKIVNEFVPEETLDALEKRSREIYKPDYEEIFNALTQTKKDIENGLADEKH